MRRILLLTLFAWGLLLSGCKDDGTRKTYPVTGTLTINGKPAEAGVLVYLHPQYPEQDRYPIHPKGETDANGAFQITTYRTNDGAPEGDYLITIDFPQRIGMSPHFGGDLFNGAFANKESNKSRPEFQLKVEKKPNTLTLNLTLTPDQVAAFEAAKKKVQEKQGGMFNLSGQ